MDRSVDRRGAGRDARRHTPALQGARRLIVAIDVGAGCANGVAPNWSGGVRRAVVDRRGRSLRHSAPTDADMSDDLQIREAAEPGQRDGVFASPGAGWCIAHEHVDIRVITVVNMLDEIGLGTDLIPEIGGAFEEHLQGR